MKHYTLSFINNDRSYYEDINGELIAHIDDGREISLYNCFYCDGLQPVKALVMDKKNIKVQIAKSGDLCVIRRAYGR